MIKVLISLVLNKKGPSFDLPFVEKLDEMSFNKEGRIIEWEVNPFSPKVIISMPWSDEDLSTGKDIEKFDAWKHEWRLKLQQCTDFREYRKLFDQYEEEYKKNSRASKKGFAKEIVFPINVTTRLISGQEVYFRLIKPDWPNQRKEVMSIMELPTGVALERKYDKACNVLVIREVDGDKEILLSRRKGEKVGGGSFAAPGGKQRAGESLEECAKRELEEETGLTLTKSKPISLYYTLKDFMGGKQIMSVGVLAIAWEGEVETKEPHKHEGWEWHKLNNLPYPLFEFTEKAINQFAQDKYPNLAWEDIEEKPDTQLSLFDDQLD